MVDSKDKGNRGEYQAARLLEKWWGSDFTKTPQSGGFSTKKFREEWGAEADVVTPDESFPFSVEVKWHEGWTLDQLLTAPKTDMWEWWEQAKGQTPEGKFCMLAFKKNRQKFFCMTRIEPTYTVYQQEFVESARIRVFDRQGELAYIRLFKDFLEEPTSKWRRKARNK
jgi:Holliday junction resolvase-like predicted endonuclease